MVAGAGKPLLEGDLASLSWGTNPAHLQTTLQSARDLSSMCSKLSPHSGDTRPVAPSLHTCTKPLVGHSMAAFQKRGWLYKWKAALLGEKHGSWDVSGPQKSCPDVHCAAARPCGHLEVGDVCWPLGVPGWPSV